MRAVGWPAPGRRYSHPFFSVRSWNKLRATSVKARRTCRRSSRRSVCKFAVHERYAPTRREPEDWSDAMPESKSTCQETPAVPPYLEAAFAPARRLTRGIRDGEDLVQDACRRAAVRSRVEHIRRFNPLAQNPSVARTSLPSRSQHSATRSVCTPPGAAHRRPLLQDPCCAAGRRVLLLERIQAERTSTAVEFR
jgi:hypothetical protein